MSAYCDEALKKLREGAKTVRGQKEKAMSDAVRAMLENFCRQEEEFAQAVVQGGDFQECMTAVARGAGTSISDLEAYQKAVQFFFPGATVKMQCTIDLIGDAAEEEYTPKHAAEGKTMGIILDFKSFL